MTNATTLTFSLSTAIMANVKARAERAMATAESQYSDVQLDETYNAIHNGGPECPCKCKGGHIYYPAAAYYLRESDAAWAEYSRLIIVQGRNARDARTGQLSLDVG